MVIIPSTQAEAAEQAQMIREGLQVHDAECCSSSTPCTLRVGMQAVLDQIEAASTRPAPRVQVATPAPRPQGSGNGFGTAKPAKASRLATPGQQGMLRKLAEFAGQRDRFTDEFLAETKMSEVDVLREWLLKKGDEVKAARAAAKVAAPKAPAVELEAGMYLKDGVVYKVQVAVHGSGRPYAKRLTQDGDEWFFEYASGAIRTLTSEHRMTPADAKEFGAIYGICCRCAATLTDEASIARGMGPTCAGKI